MGHPPGCATPTPRRLILVRRQSSRAPEGTVLGSIVSSLPSHRLQAWPSGARDCLAHLPTVLVYLTLTQDLVAPPCPQGKLEGALAMQLRSKAGTLFCPSYDLFQQHPLTTPPHPPQHSLGIGGRRGPQRSLEKGRSRAREARRQAPPPARRQPGAPPGRPAGSQSGSLAGLPAECGRPGPDLRPGCWGHPSARGGSQTQHPLPPRGGARRPQAKRRKI